MAAPPLGIRAGLQPRPTGDAGRPGRWPVPLAAKGGVKPLRWLVNGQPIAAAAWRRDAFWQPDGEGLARITVLDQAGQTASAEVWISRGAAAAATP